MSNALAVVNDTEKFLAEAGITTKTSFDAKDAQESSGIKPNRYFPFIQMLQKMSKESENFSPGHFIVKQNGKDKTPVDLGNNFEAFVVSIRGKATYWNGTTMRAEYHTPALKTAGYEEMKQKALDKVPDYRSGLDVLLWVPLVGDKGGCFAVYFANTATTVSSVEQLVAPYINKPVKFYSELRTGSKGSWYVPASTELEEVNWENVFDQEMFVEALKTFLNPVASVEEQVEGAEKAEEVTRQR